MNRPFLLAALIGTACLSPPPPGEVVAPVARPKVKVAWKGLPIAKLYRPGEIRGFRILQGGQLVGRSWGRYVGPDPAAPEQHVFETRIELLPPGGDPLRSEGRLVLDERGRFVESVERSDAAELWARREGDHIALTDGRRSDEIPYDPEQHDTSFVSHGAILHQEIMLGAHRIADGMAWRVISLSGGVPFAWEAELHSLPSTVDDTYRIGTNLGEDITLRGGRIVSTEIPDAGQRVEVMETAPEWPVFEITGPRRLAYAPAPDAAFAIREIVIEGTPELQGELLVPKGATAPAPAVLFLSRMAGEDRYGFAGPPPVDIGSHEIHDALAQAGFVVLRFDDRGAGKSDDATPSYIGAVEDARRAYGTLLVQPEVDPDRTLIVGHGEGCLRALALAVEHGRDIRGLALLAPPGRKYADILRMQSERRLSGAPPAVREPARKEQERIIRELESGGTPPELAEQAQWLREIFTQEPTKMIGRVQSRVWLAQGDKDFEVDPREDSSRLQSAARKAKVAFELARYPMLDHLFKPEPETSRPSRYLEADRRVDTKFLADLVTWARKVMK